MAYWNGAAWAPEPVTAAPDDGTPSLSRPIRPAAFIAVLALVLATASVLAAPKAGTASISLASVDGARSASVQPSLGSWVTFDTVVPNTVKNPMIDVNCYQDGSKVFGLAGALDYSFKLGGSWSVWLETGGPAQCTATLFYYSWKARNETFNPLAETEFDAAG